MSSNRHKTTMCNAYGKVLRDENLKKHKIKKHSNFGEVRQPITDLVIDNQHNDEVKAEDSEVEEFDYTPLTHHAILEFELQRDNEVYQRNVEIGGQISIILHRGIILEKSLSKQNKFCLELFRAQKLTINAENAEL